MSEKTKPVFKSKTMIVNILIALAGFIPAVADTVRENPEAVMTLIAGANIILRWVTKGKVTLF